MGARAPLATAAAVLAAVALAGCTSSPVGTKAAAPPTATSGARSVPTSAPRPTVRTATPQPPPTQDPAEATAVRIRCGVLVPGAVVKAFRVGYRAVRDPAIGAGSDAARIRRLGGTVCEWKDASTGHLVRVGVAHPGPKDLTALQNDLVDRSNAVPTYGVEGYFRPTRSGGISDSFPDGYWVHAASQDFYEPGDAIPFLQAVREALAKA